MARGGSNVPSVSRARFKKLQTEVKNMGETLNNTTAALTGTAGDAVVIGADGKATTQALAGTDYTTSRLRAMSLHEGSAPTSLANGAIAGVYEIA